MFARCLHPSFLAVLLGAARGLDEPPMLLFTESNRPYAPVKVGIKNQVLIGMFARFIS